MNDIMRQFTYIAGMAILNIRNLPDDVHVKLRVRAAKHGKSMEAEARELLTNACRQGRQKNLLQVYATWSIHYMVATNPKMLSRI